MAEDAEEGKKIKAPIKPKIKIEFAAHKESKQQNIPEKMHGVFDFNTMMRNERPLRPPPDPAAPPRNFAALAEELDPERWQRNWETMAPQNDFDLLNIT